MKLNSKNVFSENIIHLNEELYEQIFNTYYLELVKYVNVLTKNKYDAEDIVNNLFLKLGKIIQSYDYKICNFDSWLFRCVRNETINYLRSQNTKINKVIALTENVAICEMSHEFRIEELKDVLTVEEYEFIFLTYGLGFSNGKVCHVMNVTEYQRRQLKKIAIAKVRDLDYSQENRHKKEKGSRHFFVKSFFDIETDICQFLCEQ